MKDKPTTREMIADLNAIDRKADIVADLLGENPADVRDAWRAMADASEQADLTVSRWQREHDRRWAADVWDRLDDDETADRYRAKHAQDR